MDEFDEYGQYENDLENWETEQVFQDACAEREDLSDDDETTDDDMDDDE